MVIPHTKLEQVHESVGLGVFATRRIPRGTILWVQDPMDVVFELEQIDEMPPVLREPVERYSYMDHTGSMILCWDIAKFFNHSCDASCLGLDFPFELAVRDIEVGEELTDDYGTFYLEDATPFECRCGSEDCRGRVTPADRETMMPTWLQRVREAVACVRDVPQPLIELLPGGAIDDLVSRYG